MEREAAMERERERAVKSTALGGGGRCGGRQSIGGR